MKPSARVGSRSPNKLTGQGLTVDPGEWAQVDADALKPEDRANFMRRRRAIYLYLDGASDREIHAQTGMHRSNVYRVIVERCLVPHEDGHLHGWRGALPHVRVNGYIRSVKPIAREDGSGTPGSLQWLFASPEGRELEAQFREQILAKPKGLRGSGRRKSELFGWFLSKLRDRGYERRREWPFNVEKLGYVTISAFIDRVLEQNPAIQRQLLGGEDARRKGIAGDGTSRPHLGPFDRVECDAWKLDCRMVVAVPSPHGGHEMRKIHRLWVIVLIDVATRAVLGYCLSLRKEVSAEDVLRAIKHALSIWAPRKLQFSDIAYQAGAGFPSSVAPYLAGACWTEFSVDGALANVCDRVTTVLDEVVGCRVLKPQDQHSFTSRRSKDDRPFIEAYFGKLAGGTFHRIAPTTGSQPSDKHGADPVALAAATQFQLEYAEELLDVVIANFNATPHSGLGYRTPLQQLAFLVPPSAPVHRAEPEAVRRMAGLRHMRTLHGGVKTGRRPHFLFANAKYSAEWLSLRTDLIGKDFWVHIEDEDDARFATVSDTRGMFLGVVRAAPPWHQTPHSLFIRQAIRSLEHRRLLHLSAHCDAVEELIRHAESHGGKLPAHPAYLEARRILAINAAAVSESASVVVTSATPASEPKRESGSAERGKSAVSSGDELAAGDGRNQMPTATPVPMEPPKPKRAVRSTPMAKIW